MGVVFTIQSVTLEQFTKKSEKAASICTLFSILVIVLLAKWRSSGTPIMRCSIQDCVEHQEFLHLLDLYVRETSYAKSVSL